MQEGVRILRVTAVNTAPVRTRGTYVLYWMIATRRTAWSHALDHALDRARALSRPLVVLEPLRAGYRWASDRFHAFLLQGMADNARAFAGGGITYLSYVEPAPGAGSGLLAALARRASVVVTDEQPGFFLSRMVRAAGARLDVRLEQVDSNGLLPLRATDRAPEIASAFRRHLQRELAPHLLAPPAAAPLAELPRGLRDGDVPGTVLRRWPGASPELLAAAPAALAALPIDHAIAPVSYRGGAVAADAALDAFISQRLARYADEHAHPDADATSGLSPYLHFGHLAAHEVCARVWRASGWSPAQLLGAPATGQRAGWWGLPASSEAFLDELVTWRELGYAFCFHRADHDSWAALPAWARRTLDAHAADPRPETYTRRQLRAAATHDPLWNAAQRQLLVDGRIHGYLRMLWGKQILAWSKSPRAALATLFELNNAYAVDGRDPNSTSGILWTLGRFDRPWGPERPIFGTVRYMSSANTARKLRVRGYLQRWGA